MEERDFTSFFDGLARKGLWHSFEEEEAARVSQFMELWDIQPGSRILEPGCGMGRLTEVLAKKTGASGEVVAVDLSREMISAADTRLMPGNVHLIHGSALDLPPNIGTFDYILCCNVWPHFTDARRALDAMGSLLNDGGHFWIAHLCGRERINAIHQNADPVVRDHLLPPAAELAELVSESGLQLDGYEDKEDIYWIHARRAIA